MRKKEKRMNRKTKQDVRTFRYDPTELSVFHINTKEEAGVNMLEVRSSHKKHTVYNRRRSNECTKLEVTKKKGKGRKAKNM